MKMNAASIKNQKAEWEALGVKLPAFDHDAMTAKTKEHPVWVHFGAGNIFRGFIAALQQRLLNEGLQDRGIIAADTFDYDIIDKIYTPFDNLTMMVTLNPDGSTSREIIASIALEHYQALWARARSILEPNRKIVEDWVASQPHLHLRAKAMGTTCLIDYDYDVDSETLAKDAMATEQILVVPGDYFDMPKTIRVGYGAFRDPQVLKAGLEEFGKYLEKYN